MQKENSTIKDLSKTILSFTDCERCWGFEAFVLERTEDIHEKKIFNQIWVRAVHFQNWNNVSLTEGANKVVKLLQQDYLLDEQVATQIANAAAYEWK